MVKKFGQLAIALLLATGAVGLALLNIQNVAPVSLRFLTLSSIQMPVGLLLTFCWAGGLVLGTLFLILPGGSSRKTMGGRRSPRDEFDFGDFE